ncbi:MAG TPA: hypothetical protein VMK05_12110, partial [Burkholderiales bacterium]|nr:hypothetical protein [Burkholderiales bacterium]
PLPLRELTRVTAAGILTLGLGVLALIVTGVCGWAAGRLRSVLGPRSAQSAALGMLAVLLAFNVAGIVSLAVQFPVYNTMKGSYLLAATPAYMILLALGVTLCERYALARRAIAAVLGVLFALVTVHVLQIALALHALSARAG